MKITITTIFDVDDDDKTESYTARTEKEYVVLEDGELERLLDIHNEKVGVIERKLLK